MNIYLKIKFKKNFYESFGVNQTQRKREKGKESEDERGPNEKLKKI